MDASQFVHVVEARQGYKIGCVEEIAWRAGWIDDDTFRRLGDDLAKSGYGELHPRRAWREAGRPLMQIEPLSIAGAYVVTPRQFPDDRGVFLESFRGDRLAEHLGHRPDIVQTNVSVSSRGTVRGIHFADVPPGQGKYVTVLTGSLVDYVVDIRVGSPTFGRWEAVTLDAVDRRAVYLSEGLGHAFCALEDGTTAMYLCTATYNPGRRARHPPARRRRSGSPCPTASTPMLSAQGRRGTLARRGDARPGCCRRMPGAPRGRARSLSAGTDAPRARCARTAGSSSTPIRSKALAPRL